MDSPFGAAAAGGEVFLIKADIVLLEAGAAKSIAPERAKVAAELRAAPARRWMGIEKKELLFAPRPE